MATLTTLKIVVEDDHELGAQAWQCRTGKVQSL